MPAQAPISNSDTTVTAAREGDSNPPRLGRGDTRGSTEARDHFPDAPVAERIRHPPSKRDHAGGIPAGSTKIPGDVKVAWPPVKRLVVVRVHAGEPFDAPCFARLARGLRPACIRFD